MKPGPSSVRLRSKCAQSTMSFSTVTLVSSRPGEMRGRGSPDCFRRARVKTSLAAAPATAARMIFIALALIGVLLRAQGQAQRHRPDIEVAPHRIEQIAAIAFGQHVDPSAEDHERRRP